MGRFTAYDQNGRMVTDFDKSEYDLMHGWVGTEMERLRIENGKLRELVSDMWRFTGAACKKYPRLFDPSAQGGQMVQLNAIDAFELRMRELGIEVGK